MKQILLIIICLLLIGCSSNGRTSGLLMEININSENNLVWRCQSNNDKIIKITEENFIDNGRNDLSGQYQFKFIGVSEGETTITCNYIGVEESVSNIIYVMVDQNNFINYLGKEGNNIGKIPDPIFR